MVATRVLSAQQNKGLGNITQLFVHQVAPQISSSHCYTYGTRGRCWLMSKKKNRNEKGPLSSSNNAFESLGRRSKVFRTCGRPGGLARQKTRGQGRRWRHWRWSWLGCWWDCWRRRCWLFECVAFGFLSSGSRLWFPPLLFLQLLRSVLGKLGLHGLDPGVDVNRRPRATPREAGGVNFWIAEHPFLAGEIGHRAKFSVSGSGVVPEVGPIPGPGQHWYARNGGVV